MVAITRIYSAFGSPSRHYSRTPSPGSVGKTNTPSPPWERPSLLHGTHEPGQRQIVLISDGEDGYLSPRLMPLRFREKTVQELDAGGKSSKDSIEKCAQRKLTSFEPQSRNAFKAASGWLAMSHAANIRVMG